MEEVEDVIENPPEEGQYEALKTALIKILTDSSMTGMTDTSLTAMAEVADRVHEIRPEKDRIAAVSRVGVIAALREELMQLIRLEISAIMEVGKREQPSLIATINDGLHTRRICITDKESNIAFLINTGADVCVYPRKCLSGYLNMCTYELYAANSTRIVTYGTVSVDLNL